MLPVQKSGVQTELPFCYISQRNSRGARPVAFRKARAKLAGEEYPSSAETRVIDPFVCRSNSVAR